LKATFRAGGKFHSKRRIFKDAVDKLASDDGKTGAPANRPAIANVVAAASEVFAKLLMAGAAGVATVEVLGDRDFPYISAISVAPASLSALNSRLFKPATNPDLHEPVHRIVAEYCAAQYLASRIGDPADRLSLHRCLAVIAPNAVVRDELRGLLGWLAALGSRSLQDTIIDTDPYAVLANGDPAQLSAGAKQLLLRRLRELSEIDPYFRRADVWRRFNVAGFFTQDVVDELKLVLAAPRDGSHLLHLILELLQGAEATRGLAAELRGLMLDPDTDLTARLLARRCLAEVAGYETTGDFQQLLDESTPAAIRVAAEFVYGVPAHPVERPLLLSLLRQIAQPPGSNSQRSRGQEDSRYFINPLMNALSLDDTVWLLDNLSEGISCTCGATKRVRCQCRAGVSKVVGRLLDRYFELASGPHDADRVWRWVRNLKFERGVSVKDSRAVQALSADTGLRQSIQLRALEGQTDPDQLWEMLCRLRWGELHEGLRFTVEDVQAIVDYAFSTDNVILWISFAHRHDRYANAKERDELRAAMRAQARENPEFMREWAKRSRDWRRIDREDRYTPRRSNRYERRDAATRESNLAHLRANRPQIEQGRHWGWDQQFARHYLHFPDQLSDIVDNVETAERALANCFAFLAPHTPTLRELARREKEQIAEVLHAACLVRFRMNGSLADTDEDVLRAVKTNAGSASGYREGEAESFEAEIDTHIFRSEADVEAFASEYVEPTVLNPGGTPTNLWWLGNKAALEPVKTRLAAEWLQLYANASLETTRELFDICAQYSDRSQLLALIEKRCDEMIALGDPTEDGIARRRFWFLRHFFFAAGDRDGIWREVLSEPDGIFALERHAGRFNRDEAKGWPSLTADKVRRILDAYVAVWPKVFLPSSWGSGSPKGETAYRFLTDVVWQIERDGLDRSIPVINDMLSDSRFSDFHNDLRSMKAAAIRKKGLQAFVLPTPSDIVALLDTGGVASVEDMRALLIEELEAMQQWLKGAETDLLDMFWPNGQRVDENTARNRIVERLQGRMTALNTSVVIEHHMADATGVISRPPRSSMAAGIFWSAR
jgi:hypothetical protein